MREVPKSLPRSGVHYHQFCGEGERKTHTHLFVHVSLEGYPRNG